MPKKPKKSQKQNPKAIIPKISAIILIALISFLGGIGYQRFIVQPSPQEEQYPQSAIVSRIIDGDTVELISGQKIRFVGVTAPEPDEPFSKEATNLIQNLLEGKEVRLEYDAYKDDRFGRTLAYIWIKPNGQTKTLSTPNNQGEINTSIELVRQGLARVVIYEKRRALIYQEELLEAEKQAKEEKIGVWSK